MTIAQEHRQEHCPGGTDHSGRRAGQRVRARPGGRGIGCVVEGDRRAGERDKRRWPSTRPSRPRHVASRPDSLAAAVRVSDAAAGPVVNRFALDATEPRSAGRRHRRGSVGRSRCSARPNRWLMQQAPVAQPPPQPPAFQAPPAPPAPEQLGAGARAPSRFTGNPVSLDFQGADLRAVLRTFAEISGLNMVIDPSVQGTVDVSLRDVPWDQALDHHPPRQQARLPHRRHHRPHRAVDRAGGGRGAEAQAGRGAGAGRRAARGDQDAQLRQGGGRWSRCSPRAPCRRAAPCRSIRGPTR